MIWLLTQNASSPLAQQGHRDERGLQARRVVAVEPLAAWRRSRRSTTGRPRLRRLAGVAQLDDRGDAVARPGRSPWRPTLTSGFARPTVRPFWLTSFLASLARCALRLLRRLAGRRAPAPATSSGAAAAGSPEGTPDVVARALRRAARRRPARSAPYSTRSPRYMNATWSPTRWACCEVVGDDHDRQVAAQLADQLLDDRGRARVQRRARLVHEQHLGPRRRSRARCTAAAAGRRTGAARGGRGRRATSS